MLAVLTYKRDVESNDDQHLALLEAQSLIGQPLREISPGEAGRSLNVPQLPWLIEGHRTFVTEVTVDIAKTILRRFAFWDLLFLREANEIDPEALAVGNAWAEIDGVLTFATQSQVLEWTAYAKDSKDICAALRSRHSLSQLYEAGAAAVSAATRAPLTPISRRKNEYLTHGFHKYKAKFFPRLARSLINYTCPDSAGVVLDPYCGSGTTGVEASLMGMQAVEFDLDPLSAFISDSKAVLGHLDLQKFREAAARLPAKASSVVPDLISGTTPYELPRFLLERNPRRLTPEVRTEIESEATFIKQIISNCQDKETKELFELALSHALATKVSLRWMGTGDNRFALEIAKRSVYAIFRAQLEFMLRKLDSWGALRDGGMVDQYGDVSVGVSDCAKLPLADDSVDAVVTSPPYLPAASGRETYLRSRAASLVALGLMTEEAIHECESQIVGSILAVPANENLPESVTELVNWMLPQRERKSKAKPTAAYFEKLGHSLREMKRVLKPGGMVALVVSKEHMFYEMTTRRVLRRFDMVAAITELATEPKFKIGFRLDRVQTLELPKMDFAARPGSHGTYSEAILFLKKDGYGSEH
ncbi:hypothetical protein BN2475_40023 [Paraburkholderia ribeironis]|uniref:site-specific DNA-methyltransferase (cytosine-N(4)-specific) n=1 Tax=Paraburkholderia ribeironis TaxID=1247936 RepID=A0A1N7RJ70_9BURK|nr:DNA methyltransferase [Paraburkholderia ribeironis]SIT35152.1 hypothetical protein BN2475_40023 [Paraburkholderia ribeironis]